MVDILQNFTTAPDIARLAWLESLAQADLADQERVVEYREYYAGDHETELNDRLKEFLGSNTKRKFRFNQCPTVVESLVERLAVTGFEEIGADEPQPGVASPLIDFASKLWEDGRLDAGQEDVYRQAGIDRYTYLVLDVDPATGLITLNQNDLYTDVQAGGDGDGVKLHYTNKKRRGAPSFASKRWTRVDERGQKTRYMVVYYPDRIERYVQNSRRANSEYREALWQPDIPTEGPMAGIWPQPWVDGQGQPLGIPIVEFRNGQSSELHEVVPLQKALNKSFIDLIASGDMAAFGVLFAKGWVPTSDGQAIVLDSDGQITSGNEALPYEPGAFYYTTNPDGGLERVAGDNPAYIINIVDRITLAIAQVSATPLTNFQLFGQIPGQETQQQLDNRLVEKVEGRQRAYGNAWEDTIYLARRVAAGAPLYDGGRIVGYGLPAYAEFRLEATEGVRLGTLWHEARTRQEKEHLETLSIKRELGVPDEQIYLEMGYSQQQAQRFAAEREARRVAAMAAGLESSQNGQQQNNGGTENET